MYRFFLGVENFRFDSVRYDTCIVYGRKREIRFFIFHYNSVATAILRKYAFPYALKEFIHRGSGCSRCGKISIEIRKPFSEKTISRMNQTHISGRNSGDERKVICLSIEIIKKSQLGDASKGEKK